MGFGTDSEYSRSRIPKPPQKRTTFTAFLLNGLPSAPGRPGKMGVLFGAQLIYQSTFRQNHIGIRERLIFRNVALQLAAFREAHGKQILGVEDIRIVDEAVGHETADAIESLASF